MTLSSEFSTPVSGLSPKASKDTGMLEIPTKWLGRCKSTPDFAATLCNKKLIGARNFSKSYQMASSGSRCVKSVMVSNGECRSIDGDIDVIIIGAGDATTISLGRGTLIP
ncbi:hypothetical protein ACFX2I_022341 [Malus domestica]